jgi:hypothetical protein
MGIVKRVAVQKKPKSIKVIFTFPTGVEYQTFLMAMKLSSHPVLRDLSTKLEREESPPCPNTK